MPKALNVCVPLAVETHIAVEASLEYLSLYYTHSIKILIVHLIFRLSIELLLCYELCVCVCICMCVCVCVCGWVGG